MKTTALALLTSLAILSGCATIRDKAVYATEVQYVDLTVRREAPVVRQFLTTSCTCSATFEWTASAEGGSSTDCAAAADWYRVYATRWAWHVSMIQYNGNMTDTDPGPIPEIVPSCELPELPPTAGGES
jgi:uncharacterized protein YceK